MMAERARPDRELLGAGQLDWVERTLAGSVKAGTPWQVIGNQVVMARIDGPDLEKQMGPQGYAKLTERLSETARRQLGEAQASYRAGLPLNFDSWDGYPAARERLYAAFRRAGSRPVVVSGDSHAAWANDLYDARGQLVAAEFAGTSITSPSWGDLMPGIGREIAAANPKVVRFCDQDDKGYLYLTLTRDTATARYMTVSTVLAKPYALGCAALADPQGRGYADRGDHGLIAVQPSSVTRHGRRPAHRRLDMRDQCGVVMVHVMAAGQGDATDIGLFEQRAKAVGFAHAVDAGHRHPVDLSRGRDRDAVRPPA